MCNWEACMRCICNKEIGRLGSAIASLQESCDDLTKTNSRLLCDLNHLKELLAGVRGERDAARQRIARLEEEENGLWLNVCELEKNNGEVQEDLKRVMGELDGLKEERREGILKIESLIEKNSLLQADIDRVLSERDVLLAELDKRRQEAEWLRSKINEMENIHRDDVKRLEQLKAEKDNLMEGMRERERCFELLLKAKTSAESSLMESTQKLKDLQIKIEIGEISQQALLMPNLNQAAETVSVSENEGNGLIREGVTNDKELSNEIQPFAKESEAIKTADRERLHEVEDMDREIKSLKSKKRSLFTWLSSGTIVLVAVSFAFVTRRR